MNVTYFAKYSRSGPSSRYRIFQFLDSFREAGVHVTVQSLFDDRYFDLLRTRSPVAKVLGKIPYAAARFWNRAAKRFHSDPSLIVIEHQLFPYLPFPFENLFLPQRYLLEFDDAIYLTHPHKFRKMLRNASGIIAGNKILGDFARRYHEHVHLIPTVLDTDTFRPSEKTPHNLIRIGWSGLEYNFKYVQMLEQVFLKLLERYPIEIVILSGSRPNNFGFPFRFVEWDPNREVDQMSQFDIGIMPLTSDEWTRGKCGMKLLQYMSLEVPSVATPVGVVEEILEDGVNGFYARTLSDWERVLSELIPNVEVRKRTSEQGRRTVVERYSLKVWFPKLLQIYRQYANFGSTEEFIVSNGRN